MTINEIIDAGRKPHLIAPPKSVETHSHIYGPFATYPPRADRKQHVEASLEQYEALLRRLGFERGVIVQPSLYGRDNACTLDAIRRMGLERARGVAVTGRDVSTQELQRLHDAGIRGNRFYFIVDDFTRDDLVPMAHRVADFNWHLQVQDDGAWIRDIIPILADLPVASVIDHVGRTPAVTGIHDPDFLALLRFFETGKLWIKISAPYLQSTDGPPHYRDVGDKVRELVKVRPDRLVWAANWPHPNFPPDAKPEEADCLDPLLEWVPDETVRNAILADNPARLYDFPD